MGHGMKRELVYVAGYPKSGTTWLCRLLGDVLGSPVGGCDTMWDAEEPASEGWDRNGPWVIRKGHFVLVDNKQGPVVPNLHQLAWPRLDPAACVIFITRDPRDVAISSVFHWHWRISIQEFLERMKSGDHPVVNFDTGWDDYTRTWLEVGFPVVRTTYEALSANCIKEMERILKEANLVYSEGRLKETVFRQSFKQRRQTTQALPDDSSNLVLGKDWHLWFLRKGVIGDWANYFNRSEGQLAQEYFGELMQEMGNIQNADWWQSLPETAPNSILRPPLCPFCGTPMHLCRSYPVQGWHCSVCHAGAEITLTRPPEKQ